MEFEDFIDDKDVTLSDEVIGFIALLQDNFKIEHLHIEIQLDDNTTVQVKF